MNRPILVVASRHAAVAAALCRQWELFLPQEAMSHEIVEIIFSCPVDLFGQIDRIEPARLRDTMLFLDAGAESDAAWDVRELDPERGLITQLVLSFPEVYVVVCSASGPAPAPRGEGTADFPLVEYHAPGGGDVAAAVDLVRLHARGFRTWFDPTGLRSVLKSHLLNDPDHRSAQIYVHLSEARLELPAAVADEELPFVLLNGYAAYKVGYRVWVLTTEAEFTRLLVSLPAGDPPRPSKLALVLTDWDLAYSDHRAAARGTQPSLVTRIDFARVKALGCVTSYEDDAQRKLLADHNGFRAPKPYGGFDDLLCRLPPAGPNPLAARFGAVRKAVTTAPPRPVAGAADPVTRHSAPYARSGVAARLLARARRLGADPGADPVEWVHKALLAGEAKEILGGLSRTATYEAIAHQVEAEALSEVSFFGVSAQLVGVEERLRRIGDEARVVQQVGHSATHPSEREAEEGWCNFLLQLTNALRLRFAEHEQIEAAEECLRVFTRLQSRLEYTRLFATAKIPPGLAVFPPDAASPAGRPRRLARLAWRGTRYLDWATKSGTSLTWLLAVSGMWIFAFAVAFFLLLLCYPCGAGPDLLRSFELAGWHSVFTFIELQPGLSEMEGLKDTQALRGVASFGTSAWCWAQGYRLVMLSEVAVAYLHLGLLISVLYRRITKHAP